MKPLVSIIVPIYNSQENLSSCLESIINQTNKDFELVLINDGSTDDSEKICKDFLSGADFPVKYKFISNRGVSNARNVGITLAVGEWFLFLDSDDLLEKNVIDIVKETNMLGRFEMVLASFSYINKGSIRLAENNNCDLSGPLAAKNYGLWNLKICMGSYVVRKEIIDKNKILFHKDTKYGEDVEFINYCLLNSNKVKVISDKFFNYVINSKSAISKVNFNRYEVYEARLRTLNYVLYRLPYEKELISLYKNYLLPEAIIETTYLLCKKGESIFRIRKYLQKKGYYSVLIDASLSLETNPSVKDKINNFLKNPYFIWTKCIYSEYIYKFREKVGLLRRRLVG